MGRRFGFCFYVLFLLSDACFTQAVSLRFDASSPQQSYGAAVLKAALLRGGYAIKQSGAVTEIELRIRNKQLESEAYAVTRQQNKIIVTGGDERGLIYGCFSVAEDVQNGTSLSQLKAKAEKPSVALRAIKFDLPWDTYRHSYALDLHDSTCRDTLYWKAFLDMMAAARFNALSLWNLHTYPYLIKPANFPEASPWTEAEMKQWQTLFHTIFRLAKERAIDTYIVPFNIFVTPQFAKAHNVAMDNLQHDFFVRGDTSEIIKRYTRECVTQTLEEYPDLTGIGLTLGEGMAGMTPQQRENWIKETIIEGMRLAKRKSKLIHRIPFSSTTGSLGITSIETEKLTRKAIEEEAAMGFTEGPVWADLKFNWSHAHSTTQLIKVHGGKLYDTYFKPLPATYKITWTARNEDFFCLRWGVPSFVREHIRRNSQPYVGGYFIGSETYIPAKDYFTKDTVNLSWQYAFERQWLFYKIWGRLLYNPSTKDDVFLNEFIRRYGKAGRKLFEASALAGKTPLRLASDFDSGWDFTLYSEGFMALDPAVKRVEYISLERLIHQPTLDSHYVSIADHVKAVVANKPFSKEKITPPVLAAMLKEDCSKALELVRDVSTKADKALMYEAADIKAWAYLGLHFSEKIKAGVALQTYRTKGGEENKRMALQHANAALRHWDELIALTQPLYNDMPLVHLSEQDGKSWKENYKLTFHWEKLRGDVMKDVELIKAARYGQ